MEVSAPYFLDTTISPAHIYDMLIEHELHIYSEKTMPAFKNRLDFLYECGNYVYSANLIATWDELEKPRRVAVMKVRHARESYDSRPRKTADGF
jgi:hypothetical protein